MAKPPIKLTPSASEPPPIIVALHGAGVEAENPVWPASYKKQEFAWVSLLRFSQFANTTLVGFLTILLLMIL